MDHIKQLQLDIASRLLADEALATVTVLRIDGTAETQISEAGQSIAKSLTGLQTRGGKKGLAILVPLPIVECPEPDLPGPQFEVRAFAQVFENTVFNRSEGGTQIQAGEAAFLVHRCLHHAIINSRSLLFADRSAVEEVRASDETACDYSLQCNFRVALNVTPADKVADTIITLTPSGEQFSVSLACATAGAAIYFTTDGSWPWAGDAGNPSTATLYSTPFLVDADTVIRAAAYKSGLVAGNTSEKTAA